MGGIKWRGAYQMAGKPPLNLPLVKGGDHRGNVIRILQVEDIEQNPILLRQGVPEEWSGKPPKST